MKKFTSAVPNTTLLFSGSKFNRVNERKTIRNYNYPVYDDLDDFDEPVQLPKRLPQQECLRCGNIYPGGLKRCTACGLDNTRALIRPEIATPWPGFERGVIECNSCGYSTPDDNARRGRIQKCSQCAKVLYIPSGLYRITPAANQPAPRYKESHGFFWWLQDRVGARLNRFSRSRYRMPIAFMIFVMGVALIVGLVYIKNQVPPTPFKESALSVYYKNVLAIDKKLVTAEDEFDKGSGGKPQSADEFADKSSANNKTRFVRAADRMEKQVEGFLADTYAMQATLPAGAEAHYAALTAKLEEYQKYYARLKDGIDQKNEDRWKEAFAGADALKQAKTNEEQNFSQLQAVVLTPTQITAKA